MDDDSEKTTPREKGVHHGPSPSAVSTEEDLGSPKNPQLELSPTKDGTAATLKLLNGGRKLLPVSCTTTADLDTAQKIASLKGSTKSLDATKQAAIDLALTADVSSTMETGVRTGQEKLGSAKAKQTSKQVISELALTPPKGILPSGIEMDQDDQPAFASISCDASKGLLSPTAVEVDTEFLASTMQKAVDLALDPSGDEESLEGTSMLKDEKATIDFVVRDPTSSAAPLDDPSSSQQKEPARTQRPGAYHSCPGQCAERRTTFCVDQLQLEDSSLSNQDPEKQVGGRTFGKCTNESETFHTSTTTDLDYSFSRHSGGSMGLIEANPVSDFLRDSRIFGAGQLNLSEVHEEEQERQRSSRARTKQCWLVVVLACLCCVLVGSVLLVLRFRSSKSKEVETAASSPESSTMIPNVAPAMSFLIDLPENTKETIRKDWNNTSPQSKAYHWLINDPNYSNYSSHRKIQRFALAVFYYSTGGDLWDMKGNKNVTEMGPLETNWEALPPPPPPPGHSLPPRKPPPKGKGKFYDGLWLDYELNECHWYTKNRLHGILPLCKREGQIAHLILPQNRLVGTIPGELALLTKMRFFDVEGNQLSGTIPIALFEKWNDTVALLLSENRLSGTIPSDIRLVNNTLWLFKVASNRLTGSLPSQIQHLSLLDLLNLEQNYFTGVIASELGALELSAFDVSGNTRLKGSIPTELASILRPSVVGFKGPPKVVDVAGTSLTGTIPSEWCSLGETLSFDCGKVCGCDCPCT